MTDTSNDRDPRLEVRRRPTQERSRRRFESIVEAAAALIAERGLEPITMTDIANEAGIAVTAVYRYFPSRQAIVRELAFRSFDVDAQIAVASASATATDESDVAAHIAAYCRLHRDDAVRLHIRVAVQADAHLAELDLAGSRENAKLIAAALARPDRPIGRHVLERRALTLIETIDSVIRLAARSTAEESAAIIDDFSVSAASALLRLHD